MPYKRRTIVPDFFFGAKSHIFDKASELRKNMTQAEMILWSVLKKRQMRGYQFRRQHPINQFIADFYCHKAKLVIEVDGGIHNDLDQNEYDIGRTNMLEKYDIKVLRFTNDRVINDIEAVIREIESILQ